MSLDKATVTKIAHLARMKLSEDRLDHMVGELNNILDWVETLKQVDTEDVPPMTSAVRHSLRMREDKVTDGGYVDRILANAPDAEDGFFTVPKVVE